MAEPFVHVEGRPPCAREGGPVPSVAAVSGRALCHPQRLSPNGSDPHTELLPTHFRAFRVFMKYTSISYCLGFYFLSPLQSMNEEGRWARGSFLSPASYSINIKAFSLPRGFSPCDLCCNSHCSAAGSGLGSRWLSSAAFSIY